MYTKIYLIDDVELFNLMHQILFRKLGLEEKTITFTNPEKALDSIRSQNSSFDTNLILLDINMPEMTGFEFLEIIKKEKSMSNIDVIIVTSSTYYEDKLLAESFPDLVKDYVSKPLRIEKLKEILQKIESGKHSSK
jgi:CheY-like chemotaxis protein